MQILSGITVNDISIFAKLAALAPPEESKGTYKDTGKDKKSHPGRSSKADLGPLLVDQYLTHYGRVFTVKSSGKKTIYRLASCVFDESHKKNEASIIQDDSGLLTYQCFHDSCQGRTWKEARSIISSTDNLSQFCRDYDPAKAPASSPVSKDVPSEFFEGNKFVPQYLAKRLQKDFDPILYDGGTFYSYDPCGVWRIIETNRLGQTAEKALGKYAKSARIEDATKLLGHRVYIEAKKFRHNPDFLNLQNGMLELEKMRLLPHAPEYHSRIQMPVAMKGGSPRKRWEQFTHEIFPDDEGKILTLQTYGGYCLLPDCRYQRCLFMIGAGANGKSVVTDVMISILGEENVCSLPLQLMGQRFLIGQLKDKLVNVASEIATNAPIDTANFKDAVTGGLLMADKKNGTPFSFFPVAKHIFSMNESPKITDKSYGFQRRPVVLKFNQRFEGKNCDPYLTKKLIAEERDGIFEWFLEGLSIVLAEDRLYIPQSVVNDTIEMVKSTNPVLLFVDDCCTLRRDLHTKPTDLYRAYLDWCAEGRNRPLSRNRFYDQILIHYPEVRKVQIGDERIRVFDGVGI